MTEVSRHVVDRIDRFDSLSRQSPDLVYVERAIRDRPFLIATGDTDTKALYPIWTFRLWEVLMCRETWQRESNGKYLESHVVSHHRGDC
jgi:hypothetical protein